MIKLLSLFSGIGAFECALRRGGYQFETVNYCEIDPYAAKAYSQIHGISEDYNLHDVRQVNTLLMDNINLMTWGWPCQDISVAGKQRGFTDSDGNRTRSGLFFEGLRILETLQPEYAIAENVKALTGKKFTAEFETVLTSLDKAGYNNYWQVLNAKDYGVPQNRERVFIVSIRKDIDTGTFTFPEKQPLQLRVKDMLEPEVDEKFYINSDRAKKLIEKITASPEILRGDTENRIKTIGHLGTDGQKGWVFNANGISRCLAATDYKDTTKIVEPKPVICVSDQKSGAPFIIEPRIKQLGNLLQDNRKFTNPQCGRVYDPDGLAPTLNTMQGGGRQPLITEPVICASRGRNPENPSDRTAGAPTEQQLELNSQGISNTLTTVQKDNYVVEPKIIDDTFGFEKEARIYDDTAPTLRSQRSGLRVTDAKFRLRKLTPRECFRLMGFTDNDFDKIHGISNTQLYKMAGNSIVVNVLEAILKQLFKETNKE